MGERVGALNGFSSECSGKGSFDSDLSAAQGEVQIQCCAWAKTKAEQEVQRAEATFAFNTPPSQKCVEYKKSWSNVKTEAGANACQNQNEALLTLNTKMCDIFDASASDCPKDGWD